MSDMQKTVFARDLDGTGSMHICSEGDDGFVPYTRTDTIPQWQPIDEHAKSGSLVVVQMVGVLGDRAEGLFRYDGDYEHQWRSANFCGNWGEMSAKQYYPIPTPPAPTND